jgi:exodeoxyribonuclease VIII
MTAGTIPDPTTWPCWAAGITDDTYHGDQTTVSSSGLRTLVNRSPAHYQAEQAAPKADTPAMLLGRAIHARVLEPEVFAERFAVAPVCDRRTREGKAIWSEHLEQHPNATTITASDAETIEGIARSIEVHPIARAAIEGAQVEVSGYFTDHETGVRCRIRPDALRCDIGVIIDLKSALDASPRAFGRVMHQRGYHTQAAMYAAGYHAIAGEALTDFLMVAVEKAQPFAIGVYRIDDTAMMVGRAIYRDALRRYAECLAADRWPGYSDRIEALTLPAWAGADDMEAQQ